MTPEQYARLRAQDPRYRGKDRCTYYGNHDDRDDHGLSLAASSTLPRAQTRSLDEGTGGKVAAATSSTSLYDNMGASTSGGQGQQGPLRGQTGQPAGQQAAQQTTGAQQGQPVPAARASTETTTTAQVGAQATPGKVCTATQAGDGFSVRRP